jgi:hypothetical protein
LVGSEPCVESLFTHTAGTQMHQEQRIALQAISFVCK